MSRGRRSPLDDITNGRRVALKRSMACEEADFDIPVVDPAELSHAGERKVIPFSVSQMVALGEMRGTNDQWRVLLSALRAREGTVVDIGEELLMYEDQASLKEARQGPLDGVEARHVMAAMRGVADWPTVVRVEAWLRDGIMLEQTARHRASAIRLWCLCVARVASPEAVRGVVEATTEWATYDLKDAQCSGRGSDLIANVAWKRAMLYNEWLWTGVMFAVERGSYEAFWDWRKVDKACFTHPGLECKHGLGGESGMDEMPDQSMVPGGYSGNQLTLFDAIGGGGKLAKTGDEVESDDGEESGCEELIDFETHENSMK